MTSKVVVNEGVVARAEMEALALEQRFYPAPLDDEEWEGPFAPWSTLFMNFFRRFFPAIENKDILTQRFQLPPEEVQWWLCDSNHQRGVVTLQWPAVIRTALFQWWKLPDGCGDGVLARRCLHTR